jgi:(p)ppGpp synthase/HD superfamily hydrolase
VITSKARNLIHKYFKDELKNKEFRGRERWKNEILRRKISIDDKKLLEFLTEFNIQSISDFYIAIAQEDIDMTEFVDFLIKKLFEKNNEKNELSGRYDQEIKKVFKEIYSKSPNATLQPLLRNISKEVNCYVFSFVAKENYNFVKKISDNILQYNEIFITKFSFNIEKSKVTGEILFETDDKSQADSLLENLKTLQGIIQINN